jgi:hypothetical protein
LVLKVLVSVALHGADYFYFGTAVYEGTVIDMFMCQVSNEILNPQNRLWTVLLGSELMLMGLDLAWG